MAAPFLPDPTDLWPEPFCDPAAELAELEADQGSFDARQLADRLMESDTGWRIENDDQAEWAMSMLAQAKNNLTTLDRQQREYIERARTWHNRTAARPSADATFFEAQLMVYAWGKRADSRGETRTVRLPSGEIATRKAGEPEAVIVDQEAVVEWCLLNAPEVVQTTHRVLVTDLRKVVELRRETPCYTDHNEDIRTKGTCDYCGSARPIPAGFQVVVKAVDAETGEVSYPVVPGTAVRELDPWAKAKPYETR